MANLIPARYAQSTIQLLNLERAQVADVLAQCELPLALLDAEPLEGTLDAQQYGQLFMSLIHSVQEQLAGDAQALENVLDLSAYRLLYSYMIHAQNLGAALERARTYYARFHPQGQGFTVSAVDDEVTWQFNLGEATEPDASAQPEHFAMDELQWLPGFAGRIAALYTWHRLCSWMVGSFIDLAAVHVDYPLAGIPQDYIDSFRSPVYFNQGACQLRFHSRYLALPIVRNETDLDRMLETFPAELLRSDATADSTAAKVRGLLGNDFSRSLPGLEEIATRLHTTTATLHRRLRSEGTSYQMIKDQCRRDAAIALIRRHPATGSEIAEQLGFSDASTFFRAFKKWTGMTPQEFTRRES